MNNLKGMNMWREDVISNRLSNVILAPALNLYMGRLRNCLPFSTGMWGVCVKERKRDLEEKRAIRSVKNTE